MTKVASSTAASSSDEAARVAPSPALHSLPAVVPRQPRLLVLGSMPGTASLQAQRYYAHPRNLFWPMVERYLGIPTSLSYDERLADLKRQGVALWDVLERCERKGSLDGAISRASEVPNAIPALLAQHPELGAIALNGQRAADSFRRHLEDECRRIRPALHIHRLPSTSPANQSIPLAQREQAWAVLADYASSLTG